MSEEDQDRRARIERLSSFLSKPAVLSEKDQELLAELIRGAEVCFSNAEQLFEEASLLREHKHFARSIFLHQISMEECAKVDMLGAAATALTLGHPVDFAALEKAFRDHKAKNFTNAYMAKTSEAETAAREANDSEAAGKAFKATQQELHRFFNTTKNASMYVDFKDRKFIAPGDVVNEELATQIAAVSYYFMSVTHPQLRLLRRMLEDPALHSERMTALGEVMQEAISEGTIKEMQLAFERHLKQLAGAIVASEKRQPKTPEDPADWIQQFCADLPIAQNELRTRGVDVSDTQVQEYLAEALGLGDDTTKLVHQRLPPAEIVRLVVAHCEARPPPVKLGELQFEESLIPDDLPRLLTEKEIKFKGEVWVIHKNDADPFPSNPHAHNYEENLVVHLGDGRLFRKRKAVTRLGKKTLGELRTRIEEQLPGVQLPALAV